MKKNSLLIASTLFSLIFLLFACRRDIKNLINDQDVPESYLESAKIYQASKATVTRNADNSPFILLKPLWKESWNVKNGSTSILIVPTIENPVETPGIFIRRVFAFFLQNDVVKAANIIEFRGENFDVTASLDNLVANKDKETIPGFKGAIMQYDMNYFPVKSGYYENGSLVKNSEAGFYNLKRSNKFRDPNDITLAKGKISSIRGNVDQLKLLTIGNEKMYAPCVNCPNSYDPNCDHKFFYHKTYYSNHTYDEWWTYEGPVNCQTPTPAGSGSGSGSGGGTNIYGSGGSGGGYGGNPLPTIDCNGMLNGTAYTATCGCIGGNTGVSECSKVPCKEKDLVNQNGRREDVQLHNHLVLTNTQASGHEWGYEQNLVFPADGTVHYNDEREGTSGTFTPNFTWNFNDGYTLGAVHGHPGGSAPSPNDALYLSGKETRSELVAAGSADVARFKSGANIQTITVNGDYVITVKDWTALAALKAAYVNDNAYIQKAQDYLNKPGNQNEGANKAGEYALMELYGSAINLYKRDPNTTEYKPVKYNAATSKVVLDNC